jgi:ribosomal protein L29
MTFLKYKELETLSNVSEIDQEIFLLQKELFELRIKKSRNQVVNSHLFTHTRRRIAQLKFKKFSLLKMNKIN